MWRDGTTAKPLSWAWQRVRADPERALIDSAGCAMASAVSCSREIFFLHPARGQRSVGEVYLAIIG